MVGADACSSFDTCFIKSKLSLNKQSLSLSGRSTYHYSTCVIELNLYCKLTNSGKPDSSLMSNPIEIIVFGWAKPFGNSVGEVQHYSAHVPLYKWLHAALSFVHLLFLSLDIWRYPYISKKRNRESGGPEQQHYPWALPPQTSTGNLP